MHPNFISLYLQQITVTKSYPTKRADGGLPEGPRRRHLLECTVCERRGPCWPSRHAFASPSRVLMAACMASGVRAPSARCRPCQPRKSFSQADLLARASLEGAPASSCAGRELYSLYLACLTHGAKADAGGSRHSRIECHHRYRPHRKRLAQDSTLSSARDLASISLRQGHFHMLAERLQRPDSVAATRNALPH